MKRNVIIDNLACHTDGRILMTCDEGGVLENILLRNLMLTYPRIKDPQPIARGRPVTNSPAINWRLALRMPE